MPSHFFRQAAKIFNSSNALLVVPYRGFANEEKIFLKGRVLENKGIYIGESESRFRNFIDSVRRFETDEVPGVNLSVRIGENNFLAHTDEEGYFEINENWTLPVHPSETRWLTAEVQILESPKGEIPTSVFPGDILFPSKNADFGIVSDVDDTVLQTHMTSRLKLKMLYHTFFKDSHQRMPMEGIPDLMDSFIKGKNGGRENPIFYVSDSPWNLFDLLADFMEYHNLPKGPIMLRDYGTHMLKKWKKNPVQKLISFRHILEKYPNLPFVMLGDTASKDADYYIQMAKEFDGRILAIYIRQTRNNRNARRVCKLINKHSGMNAVIVKSSEEIKIHAQKNGLIK